MKRTAEITIETERVVVVAGVGRDGARGWCEGCGAESRLIAAEDAAALLRVSPPAVLRWAEAERLHVCEDADGSPLICLNSVRQRGSEPGAGL